MAMLIGVYVGLLLVLYNYGLRLLLGYFEGYSINFDFVKEE